MALVLKKKLLRDDGREIQFYYVDSGYVAPNHEEPIAKEVVKIAGERKAATAKSTKTTRAVSLKDI